MGNLWDLMQDVRLAQLLDDEKGIREWVQEFCWGRNVMSIMLLDMTLENGCLEDFYCVCGLVWSGPEDP